MSATLSAILRRARYVVMLCIVLPLNGQAALFADDPDEIKDLYYGAVLYEFYQQNFYSAAVNLLTAQQQQRLQHHDDEAQLLLGGIYLSYGLHTQAEVIFQKLLSKQALPSVADRAWFYLAKIRYHKGLFTEAQHAIAQVQGELEPALREEFLTLRANIFMAQSKFQEAVTSLEPTVGKAAEKKDTAAAHYARYNLGVALLKSGRERDGTELLREVGRLISDHPELKALRDRANLTLGYLVLKDAPVMAREFFRLVRLQGPFSNRAMLGLGWVEVELQNTEGALIPWMALSEREPVELAVFESLLLIGHGLERMQAYPQAMQAYAQAISVYESTLTTLQNTMAAVAAGRLWDDLLAQVDQQGAQNEMGWFWEAELLPDTLEAKYLSTLMASHEFHEAIKNLRDLKFLSNKLARWADEIPAYEHMLSLRRATYEEQLERLRPQETLEKIVDVRTSRDIFAARVERIKKERDAFALVTDAEQQLLDQLAEVEERIWRLSNAGTPGDDTDYAQYRDRHRLYKGLLSYDVETTFAIRHWNIKKQLNELDHDMRRTIALQDSLQQARSLSPKNFDGYQWRVEQLRARITGLNAQTDEAFVSQQALLQVMADTELAALRANLRDYLDRARFSLAHLQEQAILNAEKSAEKSTEKNVEESVDKAGSAP